MIVAFLKLEATTRSLFTNAIHLPGLNEHVSATEDFRTSRQVDSYLAHGNH